LQTKGWDYFDAEISAWPDEPLRPRASGLNLSNAFIFFLKRRGAVPLREQISLQEIKPPEQQSCQDKKGV